MMDDAGNWLRQRIAQGKLKPGEGTAGD